MRLLLICFAFGVLNADVGLFAEALYWKPKSDVAYVAEQTGPPLGDPAQPQSGAFIARVLSPRYWWGVRAGAQMDCVELSGTYIDFSHQSRTSGLIAPMLQSNDRVGQFEIEGCSTGDLRVCYWDIHARYFIYYCAGVSLLAGVGHIDIKRTVSAFLEGTNILFFPAAVLVCQQRHDGFEGTGPELSLRIERNLWCYLQGFLEGNLGAWIGVQRAEGRNLSSNFSAPWEENQSFRDDHCVRIVPSLHWRLGVSMEYLWPTCEMHFQVAYELLYFWSALSDLTGGPNFEATSPTAQAAAHFGLGGPTLGMSLVY